MLCVFAGAKKFLEMYALRRERTISRYAVTSCRTCYRRRSRKVSSESERYIDEWHRETVKPLEFYERFASSSKRKCFFYSVDLQGRLFLEEVIPKNIATSLKDVKFLDFFFRRIRRVSCDEKSSLADCGCENDYPFVSPCGAELNFVRPADAPIVFHELRTGKGGDTGGMKLVFGGGLSQPFRPEKLALSRRTGRLYHELVSNVDDGSKPLTQLHGGGTSGAEYGLIKSSIVVLLSDGIVARNTQENGFLSNTCEIGHKNKDMSIDSGMLFCSNGVKHTISLLPCEAEAGLWGLPVT